LAPVTLLLGPRQSGKTTLARQFEHRPDAHWFDRQRYLDVLEGAYLLRTLQPYSANVAKRVRKTPKLYLRDTGLLHALAWRDIAGLAAGR
jgi:predicted AAA+ superfamily ATPase